MKPHFDKTCAVERETNLEVYAVNKFCGYYYMRLRIVMLGECRFWVFLSIGEYFKNLSGCHSIFSLLP